MSWECSNCGEILEDQFDSCWKCGFSKDGTEPSNNFMTREVSHHISFQDFPCSTTPSIPGCHIEATKGIVCGEAIMGANFLRDIVAGLTDFVGGRSGVYETKLREGRAIALQEMIQEAKNLGGNAVVGVDIDYDTVGETMLMVSASGTAVLLKPSERDDSASGNELQP